MMKIKLVVSLALVSLLALAGLGLTACSSPGVAAQTASPVNVAVNSQQGIWVDGQGIVSATPDIVTLSLGVTAQSAKVADAQSQAADAMTKLMSVLTSNGIDPKDIQTQNYNIQQLTRYDNTTQLSVITGYQVSNMVSVKIRAVAKAGSIVDAVAAAGGDLTRINGVSFSVDQPVQYQVQARQLAMADAKSKADQLAKLAGMTLGRPTYISESISTPPSPVYAAKALASGSASTTPINPGQTDITVSVQVAYAIQ
jgi:uncharacterized protein YggE